MSLRIFGTTGSNDDLTEVKAEIAEVKAMATGAQTSADTADAKAVNARGMVLSDRTTNAATLAPLQAAAAQLPLTQQQAAIDHAEFRDRLTSLEARPAPIKGDTGPAGPTGAAGKDGATGSTGATGPSGTANLATAAAPVGLLALGGNADVTLTWSRAMPNNTYSVQAAHSAVISLANVVLTVKSKTTTQAVVNVKANGVAIAAGTLSATAV